jgi:hypothetical protein
MPALKRKPLKAKSINPCLTPTMIVFANASCNVAAALSRNTLHDPTNQTLPTILLLWLLAGIISIQRHFSVPQHFSAVLENFQLELKDSTGNTKTVIFWQRGTKCRIQHHPICFGILKTVIFLAKRHQMQNSLSNMSWYTQEQQLHSIHSSHVSSQCSWISDTGPWQRFGGCRSSIGGQQSVPASPTSILI